MWFLERHTSFFTSGSSQSPLDLLVLRKSSQFDPIREIQGPCPDPAGGEKSKGPQGFSWRQFRSNLPVSLPHRQNHRVANSGWPTNRAKSEVITGFETLWDGNNQLKKIIGIYNHV